MIGVIAIVIGTLGALCWAWGAIGVFFMGMFADFMKNVPGSQGQAEMYRHMEDFKYWTFGVSCFASLLSVCLLTLGIMFLKRHPSTPRLCVIWSILKIPAVVGFAVVGYSNQHAQFEAMANQPGMTAPMMGTMANVMSGVTVAFGLAWGWALPVFFLIWFTRSKIKAETATWT